MEGPVVKFVYVNRILVANLSDLLVTNRFVLPDSLTYVDILEWGNGPTGNVPLKFGEEKTYSFKDTTVKEFANEAGATVSKEE